MSSVVFAWQAPCLDDGVGLFAEKVYRGRHRAMDRRTGQIMQLFKYADLPSWASEQKLLYLPAQREYERLRAPLAQQP